MITYIEVGLRVGAEKFRTNKPIKESSYTQQ